MDYLEYLKVIVIVCVAGLAAIAGLAYLGHRLQHRPAALDRKLPGFEGHTTEVAAHTKGLHAHLRDLAEDVADEPHVDLTGTQRYIDNARLSAALERLAGRQ